MLQLIKRFIYLCAVMGKSFFFLTTSAQNLVCIAPYPNSTTSHPSEAAWFISSSIFSAVPSVNTLYFFSKTIH